MLLRFGLGFRVQGSGFRGWTGLARFIQVKLEKGPPWQYLLEKTLPSGHVLGYYGCVQNLVLGASSGHTVFSKEIKWGSRLRRKLPRTHQFGFRILDELSGLRVQGLGVNGGYRR